MRKPPFAQARSNSRASSGQIRLQSVQLALIVSADARKWSQRLVEHVQNSKDLVARTHSKALTAANGCRYQDVWASMEIETKVGCRLSKLDHLDFYGL